MPTLTACEERAGDAEPTQDSVLIFGPDDSALNVAQAFRLNTLADLDQCFFIVQQTDSPLYPVTRSLFITKEQGAICEASVRRYAESLGVSCEIP